MSSLDEAIQHDFSKMNRFWQSNLVFISSLNVESSITEMIKLHLTISLSITVVVSSKFLSDGIKEFRFTKTDRGSDEYNFE